MSNKDSAAEQRCKPIGYSYADAPMPDKQWCETHGQPIGKCSFSEAAASKHEYKKFGGMGKTDWCAVCWNGSKGEIRFADDPIHQFSDAAASEGVPERIWVCFPMKTGRRWWHDKPFHDGDIEFVRVSPSVDEAAEVTTPLADVEEDKNSSEVGKPPVANVEGVLAAATDGQSDLLPCPFCGSSATAMRDEKHWWVECDTCGASTPTENFTQHTVHADPDGLWNSRTRSSDASGYVRGLGVTSEVAQKLLNIREALARENIYDAWHWLYKIADPEVGSLTPWKELEAAALISQHQETK